MLAICWFLGEVIGATCLLVASGVCLFCGYRPKPLWKNIKGFLEDWRDFDINVGRYQGKYDTYKLWFQGDENDLWVCKRMPVAPWEVVLLLLLVAGIYVGIYNFPYVLPLFIKLIIIFVFIGIVSVYSKKLMRWYQEWREDRKSPEELERWRLEEARQALEEKAKWERRYQDWLAKNYNLARRKGAVNLDDLPAPLGFGDRVVQMFQVNFWSLKAKVCRPYSR